MEKKLYYFIACVISILFLARGERAEGKRGSTTTPPLVKPRRPLTSGDLWSLHTQGSMVGIIGGDVTDILEHPFEIAIDHSDSFVCAGALLNRLWAISLASCIEGATASSLTIRTGSNSNLHGGTVFNVTTIVVHPQFNYTTMDYDFALLKLNSYICPDNRTNYISFSAKTPKAQSGTIVSGWGDDSKNTNNTLRQLEMTVITNKKCKKDYSKTSYSITDRMFCAKAGKKGPCYNDFGDTLVVNGTLYGLYSWSVGCASPNYPAVFNNLASVADWIQTEMNQAACVCSCGLY